MRHRVRRSRAATLLVVALAALGACSDDGDDRSASSSATTTTDATDSTSTTVKPEGTRDEGPVTTDTTTDGAADEPSAAATALPDDVCGLLPRDEAEEAVGHVLPDGVSRGDDLRRVCAFPAGDTGDVSVTVGIEGGSSFDEKATASREAAGADGEPVADLGDEALFFYRGNLPEGVGGLLVAIGDLTVDVTMSGLDEDEMRDAAAGLARLILSEL